MCLKLTVLTLKRSQKPPGSKDTFKVMHKKTGPMC